MKHRLGFALLCVAAALVTLGVRGGPARAATTQQAAIPSSSRFT